VFLCADTETHSDTGAETVPPSRVRNGMFARKPYRSSGTQKAQTAQTAASLSRFLEGRRIRIAMSCGNRILLLLLVSLLIASVILATMTTYYDILELRQDASLTDIKKAYRRLAMLHHPDRNRGNEEQATLIFQKVSEAYEVLSEETKRKEYDDALARGSGENWKQHQQKSRPYREPFAQFNDLFRNDAFFNEAFRGMDDRFAREFQQGNMRNTNAQCQKQTWGEWMGNWLLDRLGANIQITTSTTINGQQSSSTYQRAGTAYTKKSSRTVYENGQLVTIQSLEKNGNSIEEKYIGEKLVGRLINGVPEGVGRLDL
jgi:curved DNA-binding protein CbpA